MENGGARSTERLKIITKVCFPSIETLQIVSEAGPSAIQTQTITEKASFPSI